MGGTDVEGATGSANENPTDDTELFVYILDQYRRNG